MNIREHQQNRLFLNCIYWMHFVTGALQHVFLTAVQVTRVHPLFQTSSFWALRNKISKLSLSAVTLFVTFVTFITFYKVISSREDLMKVHIQPSCSQKGLLPVSSWHFPCACVQILLWTKANLFCQQSCKLRKIYFECCVFLSAFCFLKDFQLNFNNK